MCDEVAPRIAHWSFERGRGRTATEHIHETECPIEYTFVDATDRPDRDPRWVDGVDGTGLLFDGYSTAVSAPSLATADRSALTLEAWIAPRTFGSRSTFDAVDDRLSPIVSQYDPADETGFVFGVFRHGKWGFKIGLDGETASVWADDDRLDTYEWAHVAATYDAESGTLSLVLNGESVASTSIDPGQPIAGADVDCYLARHPVRADPERTFDPDVFDGVLDELVVHEAALSESTLASRHEQTGGESVPEIEYDDIALDPSVYEGDRHRPQYHLLPPGHWMNEPHGPIYYDGQYHLFYQFNPRGPYWHHIHWGHWVSDDLVHWRHLPPALSPEDDALDPDGCWSGGATYDEDGVPALFYTAGDMSRTPNQAVVTASPSDPDDPDLIEWGKSDDYAIEKPRGIGLRENDFRDPFVWKEGEVWYCLVGSGVEGNGGTALIYSSRSFEDWQFRGHLYRSDYDDYPELGQVWELPVLLPIGEDDSGLEKHLFVISPVGEGADVEVYYWIGEWDPETCSFTPDDERPQLIDYGDFHFTGPHGFVDPETDRSILFTITQDNRSPEDHYDAGWAHNGGLPVHLYLRDDNRLGVEPIEELQSLRSDRLVAVQNEDAKTCNEQLDAVASDTIEVKLEIESRGANRYGLLCRKHPEGDERTLIYYDETAEELTAHREHSSLDPRTRKTISDRSSLIHSGDLSIDGTLQLTLYLDKSMLECYANQRRSITTRVYAETDESSGLEIWADGDVSVSSLSVWELDSVW